MTERAYIKQLNEILFLLPIENSTVESGRFREVRDKIRKLTKKYIREKLVTPQANVSEQKEQLKGDKVSNDLTYGQCVHGENLARCIDCGQEIETQIRCIPCKIGIHG